MRSIENRLSLTAVPPPVACKMPTRPSSFADQNGQEQIEPKTKAMGDLIGMALACNQTRVFSMLYTGSVASTVFWEVGLSEGHHQLTHDEPGLQPQVQASTVFTVKMFGTLLQSLKAIPEGAGNVLDSCAIMASSDTSDGRFHNIRDYPILVAGKAGGFLKYPGIHYRSPSGDESCSTVLLTMLRAVGTGLGRAGDGPGLATTSCTAIEA